MRRSATGLAIWPDYPPERTGTGQPRRASQITGVIHEDTPARLTGAYGLTAVRPQDICAVLGGSCSNYCYLASEKGLIGGVRDGHAGQRLALEGRSVGGWGACQTRSCLRPNRAQAAADGSQMSSRRPLMAPPLSAATRGPTSSITSRVPKGTTCGSTETVSCELGRPEAVTPLPEWQVTSKTPSSTLERRWCSSAPISARPGSCPVVRQGPGSRHYRRPGGPHQRQHRAVQPSVPACGGCGECGSTWRGSCRRGSGALSR